MFESTHLLKIFLCHASQDKPIVRELYEHLMAEKWIDAWLDEKKLLPGQDWRLNIERAVESSDIVIICLSSNSVNKEGFVQKELRYAREIALEKLEEAIFLIPLRINECDIPRGLRFYQWADYFGEKKDEAYKALQKSLKLRYEQKLRFEKEKYDRNNKEKMEPETAEKIAEEKANRAANIPLDIAPVKESIWEQQSIPSKYTKVEKAEIDTQESLKKGDALKYPDKTKLRKQIITHFNREEFETLCNDFQTSLETDGVFLLISITNFGEKGFEYQVRDMLDWLQRRSLYEKFVDVIRENRKNMI